MGKRVFPWARSLAPNRLAAFIDDLWGAAGTGGDLRTLNAIEQVIAAHRQPPMRCPLSPREVDILTHLASGKTYEQAARAIGIAPDSLRSRMPQIYARLGARNGMHAAAIAISHDWLPDLAVRAVEPPPLIVPGPHTWNKVYQDRANWLREHPGEPTQIGPYTAPGGARRAARCIRLGLFEPFKPAGAFTAQHTRSDLGHWVVAATYIAGTSTAHSTEGIAS